MTASALRPPVRMVRALLACALLATRLDAQSIAPSPAVPPDADVAGRLELEWGMQPSMTGRPTIRAFVFDDARRANVEVTLDDAVTRQAGGLLALNGKRVRLRLEPSSSARGARRVAAVSQVSADPSGRRIPDLTWSPALGAQPSARSAGTTTGPSRSLAGVPMTGSRRYVVLLCKFNDVTAEPNTRLQYQGMLFGTNTSVEGYWRETSENRLDFTGSAVIDWVTLPHPRSYYFPNGATNADLGALASDCTGAADSQVNFPDFDGVLTEYNASLGCCGWGGGMTLALDGVQKSYGFAWYPPLDLKAHGFVAHEIGHSLGLPHSGGPYGRTYDSNWDVMSSGGPYYDPTIGYYGAQTIAYHKDLLGWIPGARRFIAVDPSSTVTLERHALPGANTNFQEVVIPIPGTSNFYTLEARLRAGFDGKVPFEGVVVHEVELVTSAGRQEPAWVVDPDGNGNPNDASAVWTVGETFADLRHQISVTVDAVTSTSVQVTVRNGTSASMTLSRSGKKTTVTAGGAASNDSVDVVLSGGGGGSIAWSAATTSMRGGWLQLQTASGSGSGRLRFRHDPSSMGVGTYVDSIRVSGSGGLSATYVDTLVVGAPTSLFLGLSMRTRSDSLLAPYASWDSVDVRIDGPGATTAAWTATKRHATTVLQQTSGTGSGRLRWYRTPPPSGLPALDVDTITVAIAATPSISAVVVDSFRTTEPVKYTVSPRTQRGTVVEGAYPVRDSVNVSFNGRWATGARWYGFAYFWGGPSRFLKPDVNKPDLSTAAWTGLGNGKVVWSRGSATLPTGTYIDTLHIQGPWWWFNVPSTGHEKEYLLVDTLTVVSAPLALSLSAPSRRDTVFAGLSPSADSVLVNVTGTGASTTQWSVVSKRKRSVLITEGAFVPVGQGTGSAWQRWTRNVSGLTPGVYVDTLVFSIPSTALTATLVDTTVVRSGAILSVSARSRLDSTVVGSTAARVDSVGIELLGVSTVAWSATHAAKPWLTLTNATGSGTSVLRWSRDPSGLAVGVYVDTITIASNGAGGSVTVVDSLKIVPATRPIVAYLTPDSSGAAFAGAVAADLTLDLSNAGTSVGAYRASVTWDSLVVRLDSVRSVPTNGFAVPTVVSQTTRDAVITASGTTTLAIAPLARLYFRIVNDTAGRVSAMTPTFLALTSPSGTDLRGAVLAQSAKIAALGVLHGDISLDGLVSAADAQALLAALVDLPVPAAFRLAPQGDANCDGKLEAVDAQIILRKVVGLPTTGTCVGQVK